MHWCILERRDSEGGAFGVFVVRGQNGDTYKDMTQAAPTRRIEAHVTESDYPGTFVTTGAA